MTNYTAADFANAQFAKHPDGRLAHRVEYGTVFAWSFERNDVNDYAANEYMAHYGWVPVPTKPTLTESQVVRVYVAARDNIDEFHRELKLLGFEIIPDPEPTNTEKWEMFCRSLRVNLAPWQIDYLVKAMDDRGVAAPNVKDN